MSEQLFTKEEVESIVTKLSDFGNNLNDKERKLLELLIAKCTIGVPVGETEIIEDIKTDLESAVRDALERFIGAPSLSYNDENFIKSPGGNVYSWHR